MGGALQHNSYSTSSTQQWTACVCLTLLHHDLYIFGILFSSECHFEKDNILHEILYGFVLSVDPNIVKEDKLKKERTERINEEAFGDGPQPKLEFAQYKVKLYLMHII